VKFTVNRKTAQRSERSRFNIRMRKAKVGQFPTRSGERRICMGRQPYLPAGYDSVKKAIVTRQFTETLQRDGPIHFLH
jgi:hypothetical protein